MTGSYYSLTRLWIPTTPYAHTAITEKPLVTATSFISSARPSSPFCRHPNRQRQNNRGTSRSPLEGDSMTLLFRRQEDGKAASCVPFRISLRGMTVMRGSEKGRRVGRAEGKGANKSASIHTTEFNYSQPNIHGLICSFRHRPASHPQF